MSIANLGSISTRVFSLIDGIPSNLSGAPMDALVYDEVIYMEAYTGQSIGSTAIAEKYQPALVMLSAGAVQRVVDTQGGDRGFSLGDLTVNNASKGSSTADSFTADGMEKLKRLGRKFQVFKAYG
jgi:hypothetical protein